MTFFGAQRLNRRQRFALIIAALLLVGMWLYRPWVTTVVNFDSTRLGGWSVEGPPASRYAWFFGPGDEREGPSDFESVLRSLSFLGGPFTRHFGQRMKTHYWPDWCRLSVQWLGVIALAAAGVYVLRDRLAVHNPAGHGRALPQSTNGSGEQAQDLPL